MSSPEKKSPGGTADAHQDPNLELARLIFIGMAQRIYSAPSAPEQKKPDPKALATLCFASPRPSMRPRARLPR
jgi:hypothetical protein